MGFTIIDDSILEADEALEPMEKLLLIYIFKYHNDKKGYAFPSMKVLTKHLNYSHDRYTKRHIDSLIDKGYIKKETVKQKNRYYLLCYVQNVPKVQNVHNSEVQDVPNSNVQNVPTNNNKKNTNKKTNLDILIDEYTSNENLKETLIDFLKMRKSTKSPMSEKALKMLFNKLDGLADTDELKVDILDQSIFNSWKSIYPLKNQEKKSTETPKAQLGKSDIDYSKMTPEQIMELGRGKEL